MDDSIADDLMEPNWRFLPDETRRRGHFSPIQGDPDPFWHGMQWAFLGILGILVEHGVA